MKTKKIYNSFFLAIASTLIGIIFDQYTKILAATRLKDQGSIDIIKGVFQLQYLENRGAAFGILQNHKLFFLIGGAIVLILAILFYLKMPFTNRFRPLRICIVLIAAGAIGNMIDRIRVNYVIDFLYFELIDFPIFNIADIYVTVSACFLVFLILFYYKDEDLDVLFTILKWKHTKEQGTSL